MNTFPKINLPRLEQSIAEMARFGIKSNGGCCRIALTDEDKQGRDRFVEWCTEAGCQVHVDAFGNIFAVRCGSDGDSGMVLTGSHLDTQPNGGKLDGVYGVLAGLEVIRTLNDHNIRTSRPIVVIDWTNEEGARFSPGLTGSSGFSGHIDIGAASAITGADGKNFIAELGRIGYAGSMDRDAIKPAAYIELHIEQGPVLERCRREIGVVTGVQGVRWYEVDVSGSDRHAGTTPMDDRQDSFFAVARMAEAMRRFALSLDSEVRFTIGRVAVQPG
ncbi:hydantoinase/carbamoylase family amidase [Paraburkholderia youngii]|uniref:Hydantoinase/carbamoylase family amidase n=2 Tax=Paraburkholderia TaxID=1822464 RepID=A0A7Y6K6W8_9BURK|nr:hydantoinase/carbamoylase family amidase [Paraburkholderia youngii]NUY05527.1 hydantoinase/carbamoylase family amidase [Paraburkholderia youngii]